MASSGTRSDLSIAPGRGTGLADLLDRVLDKGLVIAGDIKVSLAEVELLTIRVRLIVCSLDKAREIGLDWWKYDRYFSPGNQQQIEGGADLKRQIRALERKVAALTNSRGLARPLRRQSTNHRRRGGHHAR